MPKDLGKFGKTHHIMIDEAFVTPQLLTNMSHSMGADKYLWVARNSGYELPSDLQDCGFHIPSLEFNLRNCRKIQDFAGVQVNPKLTNFPEGEQQLWLAYH